MRKDYFELTYKLRIREISAIVIGVLIILFYTFPKVVATELVFEDAEYTEILNSQQKNNKKSTKQIKM